jgi:hypothetical protein
MVNPGEPLINVVTSNKPKVLTVSDRNHRLEPKGKGSGNGAKNSPFADDVPSAKRRDLSHPNGADTERGKPVDSSASQRKRAARDADGSAGNGCWRKRRPVCNEPDRSSNFAPRESGQTSSGSFVTRELEREAENRSSLI